MSTVINIKERLEINNVNGDTYEFTRIIKPYIEQINGMAELQELTVLRLCLSVDDESVEVKDVECYESDNGLVVAGGVITQRQTTHCVVSKEHELFSLLDKLPQAKKISLSIEYDILHSKYINEYGANYFDLHLRDMHEQLSSYILYKCCMHYPENDSLNTTHFYLFDKTSDGYVPYVSGNFLDTDNRNWMIENFNLCISVDDLAKREKVISVMQKRFEKYHISENVEDDGFGNAFVGGNGFIENGKISDFIQDLKSVVIYVANYDSEPELACTVFSTDNDNFIAVKVYTNQGKIETEYCFC